MSTPAPKPMTSPIVRSDRSQRRMMRPPMTSDEARDERPERGLDHEDATASATVSGRTIQAPTVSEMATTVNLRL